MNRAAGRRHPWTIPAAMILLMLLFAFPAVADGDGQPAPSTGDGATGAVSDGFPQTAVGLFRRHISPIDGDRCPMSPSCSRYSLDAVHKHGLVMGWIMTCDRLLRCGRDELSASPRILADEKWRGYDPVENNDFWWNR